MTTQSTLIAAVLSAAALTAFAQPAAVSGSASATVGTSGSSGTTRAAPGGTAGATGTAGMSGTTPATPGVKAGASADVAASAPATDKKADRKEKKEKKEKKDKAAAHSDSASAPAKK